MIGPGLPNRWIETTIEEQDIRAGLTKPWRVDAGSFSQSGVDLAPAPKPLAKSLPLDLFTV
ncbi:MAG: hypothetical protein ACYTFT_03680, partial [Planctomycetota bacterium]